MRVGRSRGFVYFRSQIYRESYILCPVEGDVLCAKLFCVELDSDVLGSQIGRETGAVANVGDDVPARHVLRPGSVSDALRQQCVGGAVVSGEADRI